MAAAVEAAETCTTGEGAAAKALAVEITKRRQLEKDLAALQEKLHEAEQKLIAKEQALAAAEAKAERALAASKAIRENARVLDELEEARPLIDWHDALRTYVERHDQQKDADNTVAALRSYLTPWVDWLVEFGSSRPTNQRIRKYLEAMNDLTRLSYWKIGHAIEKFSNHHLEEWERVRLIPPVGQAKPKGALAMPAEMVETLTAYVTKMARSSFEPPQEKSADPEARENTAKYLGKYLSSAADLCSAAR